jgi:hypothetical protein
MNYSGNFESPNLLIERAKKHFGELVTEGKAFFDSKPYVQAVEEDKKTGEQLHKLKFTAPLPPTLKVCASDIANNLRSALDQAVWCSVVDLGEQPDKKLHFPFGVSMESMENAIKGRLQKVAPKVVTLIRSFQPYKGGDDLLWGLSKLSAANKHQMLVPVAATTDAMLVNNMTISGPASIPVPVWDKQKNELVFARVGKGGILKYDVAFSFYLAFGDIEIVKDQPTIPTLHTLIGKTENILSAIEKETTQLRLSRPTPPT